MSVVDMETHCPLKDFLHSCPHLSTPSGLVSAIWLEVRASPGQPALGDKEKRYKGPANLAQHGTILIGTVTTKLSAWVAEPLMSLHSISASASAGVTSYPSFSRTVLAVAPTVLCLKNPSSQANQNGLSLQPNPTSFPFLPQVSIPNHHLVSQTPSQCLLPENPTCDRALIISKTMGFSVSDCVFLISRFHFSGH